MVLEHIKYRIASFLLWEKRFQSICVPKIKCRKLPPPSYGSIIRQLKDSGFRLENFRVDIQEYHKFLKQADYAKFNIYYGKRLKEKVLEYYLAAKLLGINSNDIYIDIANRYSPAPDIYAKLFGCRVYKQDFIFPEGIHGDRIGGNAARLPLENEFATKLGLHCSLEHFEEDSDIGFIKEAGRILRPGGKLCILPLYLSQNYLIVTDPLLLPAKGIAFDPEAKLYCIKNLRNRYERYYDIAHFKGRIIENSRNLKLTIFVVENADDIDRNCYLKFAAVFEKTA